MPYGDPPPPKTPEELANEEAAAGGSGTADEHAALRKWLRDEKGISLPITLPDIETIGKQLRLAIDEVDRLEASQRAGWGVESDPSLLGNFFSTESLNTISKARAKVRTLTDQLYSYAGEYFGSQGQTVVSRTLRPPIPDVTKLPTAEEFLGGFEEAYATHIEGLKKNGGLTNEEAQFAYDAMRNETYQKYMAKLGEFAKAGMSPFIQKEVSREERGTGAGTAAGAALDKALGPGVTEPTTITGTGEEVSAAMDKAGQGVPKEFTTAARLSPLDFLSEALSPSDIKVKYAGSPEGALKSIRGAPAGYTANPRRV